MSRSSLSLLSCSALASSLSLWSRTFWEARFCFWSWPISTLTPWTTFLWASSLPSTSAYSSSVKSAKSDPFFSAWIVYKNSSSTLKSSCLVRTNAWAAAKSSSNFLSSAYFFSNAFCLCCSSYAASASLKVTRRALAVSSFSWASSTWFLHCLISASRAYHAFSLFALCYDYKAPSILSSRSSMSLFMSLTVFLACSSCLFLWVASFLAASIAAWAWASLAAAFLSSSASFLSLCCSSFSALNLSISA